MKRQGYVAYFNGEVQSPPFDSGNDVYWWWRNKYNGNFLANKFIKPITYEIEDEMEEMKTIKVFCDPREMGFVETVDGYQTTVKNYMDKDLIEATLTYSVKAKKVTREEIEERIEILKGHHAGASVKNTQDLLQRILAHGLADSGGGITRKDFHEVWHKYISGSERSFQLACEELGL